MSVYCMRKRTDPECRKMLISKIEKVYPTLSKGHKRIADFITEHYDKAAFMTAAKLGESVGISESTVVRLPRNSALMGIRSFRITCKNSLRTVLQAFSAWKLPTST
jgi:DNA-binding MurR/RpiR family transcriptional regulator